MKYLEIKKIIAERAARALPSQRLPGFHDLMTEFGVSQSTVTKALDLLEAEGVIIRKRGSGILPATSKRSITLAQRKHQPKAKSHTILFSYPAYYSGGLWYMLNTIEQCTHARHSNILFHKRTVDSTMEDFVASVRKLKRITGIMYDDSSRRLTDHELELLGSLGCRVVFFLSCFDYPTLPENVFSVKPDEIAAGEKLAAYLLERGHRTPGLIIHSPKLDSTENFFLGIRRFYQKRGFPIDDARIFRAGTQPWEDSLKAAENTVRTHIQKLKDANVSALIFASSDGAVSAIRALRENGLRVPEDMGIAGHGDMPLYQYMPDVPAISCFDFSETTNRALDFILQRRKAADRVTFIPPTLKPYNGIADRT